MGTSTLSLFRVVGVLQTPRYPRTFRLCLVDADPSRTRTCIPRPENTPKLNWLGKVKRDSVITNRAMSYLLDDGTPKIFSSPGGQ